MKTPVGQALSPAHPDDQNSDGGWPYRKGGGSWTEPTVYSLLALVADQADPQTLERGTRWLRENQRADGGWPPRPSVAQSTWVTALVLLLPREQIGSGHTSGVNWLMGLTGRESSFLYRLRQELLGNAEWNAETESGWPWFPGAAAWVMPTALSILALEKAHARKPPAAVGERIASARRFLLANRCSDGGWNHGSSRVLGVEASSYPETTGVALLALHGVDPAKVSKALETAQAVLARCQSAEASSWLQLGLSAHSALPPQLSAPRGVCRTVQDSALAALARAAGQGRNVFLG